MAVSNIDDNALLEAYKKVADVKQPENWVVFLLDGKTLTVKATGSGGLSELKEQFNEEAILFAALHVKAIDKQENLSSVRSKLLFITFIGAKVKALARGKVSVQKPEVQKLMQGHALSLEYSVSSDLTEADLAKRLLAAGGAHKPTAYDFGGSEYQLPKE